MDQEHIEWNDDNLEHIEWNDDKCALVYTALMFAEKNTTDQLQYMLYVEAFAYFSNFVYTWDDIINHERPVTQRLPDIVKALELYIEHHPESVDLAITCVNDILHVVNNRNET